LKLPAKVQHYIKVGLVSVGHAKVLLGVEDPKTQELLCNLVINNGISVRQLEEKVRLLDKQKPAKQKASTELPDEYYRVLEHMGKFFENSISLKRSDSGKGTMTIRFSSDEEIRKFLQALEDKNI
jgi:ParB family chromosome partitioning protein